MNKNIILFSLADKPYHTFLLKLFQSARKFYPEIKLISYIVDDLEEDEKRFFENNSALRFLEYDTRIPKPLFCASRRAYLFPKLRKEYPDSVIVWIDADSVFMKREVDYLNFLQDVQVSMRPKDLEEGRFASGVIVSGENSIDFFNEYRDIVNREISSHNWLTDQLSLNKAYALFKEKDFGFKPLPNKYCDVWFKNDGVLWIAKGHVRDKMYSKIAKMEKINKINDFYDIIPRGNKKMVHSKAIQVLKYLDKNNKEVLIDHPLRAAQNNHAISELFPKLFSMLSDIPGRKRIIEIGTWFGGLTIILDTFARASNLDYELYTFELNPNITLQKTKEIHKSLGIRSYIGDCFSSQKEKIQNLITDKSVTTIVLCDGGNKAAEVNNFSDFLKPGDIIMGHDYGHDASSFKSKEWTAHELRYADVKESFGRNNLKFILKKQMENAVWFGAQK